MNDDHNPGHWPTGPLDSPFDYHRREVCNAAADVLDAILDEVRPLAEWLGHGIRNLRRR